MRARGSRGRNSAQDTAELRKLAKREQQGILETWSFSSSRRIKPLELRRGVT